MTTELFLPVLNQSIAAAGLVLMVLVIRLILKPAPKVFSYGLWAVVFFRMLCPFSLPLPGFLSLALIGSETVPPSIVYDKEPAIQSGIDLLDRPINQLLAQSLPPVRPENSVNPMGILLEVGSWIWLAGVVLLLVWAVCSYLRLKGRLAAATLAGKNLYESDRIVTPFVLGVFSPKIYLPLGLSETERSHILIHERCHIRRGDHWIKPLAFLALTIHWFNPLLWFAYRLMSKDMEMSCDEQVISGIKEDIRGAYSTTLLTLSARQSGFFIPLAFGENNVKSRIRNILSYQRPGRWMLAAAGFLVTVSALGLLTGPKEPFSLEKTTESAMVFESRQTDLLLIGQAAYEHYYSSFQGWDIPEEYRIVTFELQEIQLMAGDSQEFCVSIVHSYTTTGLYFLSANGNNVALDEKGYRWEDCYQEFRIRSLGDGTYQIISMGTGGGAIGLTPAGGGEPIGFSQ